MSAEDDAAFAKAASNAAPIIDKMNLGTGLRLVDRSKPAPVATCPNDDEPLIATMERPGAEFVCVVCGHWYGFLSPKPADPTPELEVRYQELRARFKAGVRHSVPSPKWCAPDRCPPDICGGPHTVVETTLGTEVLAPGQKPFGTPVAGGG